MIWLIYDALMILLVVICVFIFMKRGLVASLVGMLSMVVSLVVAWFLSDWLAASVYNIFVRDSVHDKLLGSTDVGGTSLGAKLVDTASQSIDNTMLPLVRMLLFAVLFIILYLVLRILERVFRKVNDAPLLGTVNKLLGGVIGLILGLLLCLLVAMVASILVMASVDSLSWLNSRIVEQTLIFKHFYNFNILDLLLA